MRSRIPPSKGRLWARRLAVVVVVGYLAGLLLFVLLQDRLLYRPTTYGREEFDRRIAGLGLEPWPSAGDYRALAAPPPAAAHPGTVLVVHGNAGSALGQAVLVERLAPVGLRVLIHEYPGFGARPGSPDADLLVADLIESIRRLRAERRGPLIVVAVSVGTGLVARALAEGEVEIDALVLATPFSNRRAAWQRRFPFLPMALLLREDLDNLRDLSGFEGPTAVIVAGRDTTTPPDQGRAVHESLRGRKHLFELPKAEHGSWIREAPSGLWTELAAFLRGEPEAER